MTPNPYTPPQPCTLDDNEPVVAEVVVPSCDRPSLAFWDSVSWFGGAAYGAGVCTMLFGSNVQQFVAAGLMQIVGAAMLFMVPSNK